MIEFIKFRKFLEKIHSECLFEEKPLYEKSVFESSILSWDDVNNAINFNIGVVDIIDNDGNRCEIPVSQYFWSNKLFQNKNVIVDDIKSGNCFSISQCFFINKNINTLLSIIEDKFYVVCDAHLYGGINGQANSFSPHVDIPSNFIIQIEGETPWKIYKNIASDMYPQEYINSFKNLDCLEIDLEVTLNPGDVLYIPPRRYHAAFPVGKRLSLSIPSASRKYSNVTPIDRSVYDITR